MVVGIVKHIEYVSADMCAECGAMAKLLSPGDQVSISKNMQRDVNEHKNIMFAYMDKKENLHGFIKGYPRRGDAPINAKNNSVISVIEWLYVKEKSRGQGIGYELIQKFIDYNVRLKIDEIQVVACEPAVPFYLKAGFEKALNDDYLMIRNIREKSL